MSGISDVGLYWRDPQQPIAARVHLGVHQRARSEPLVLFSGDAEGPGFVALAIIQRQARDIAIGVLARDGLDPRLDDPPVELGEPAGIFARLAAAGPFAWVGAEVSTVLLIRDA